MNEINELANSISDLRDHALANSPNKLKINNTEDTIVEIRGKMYTINFPSTRRIREMGQLIGTEVLKMDLSKVDWVEILQDDEKTKRLTGIVFSLSRWRKIVGSFLDFLKIPNNIKGFMSERIGFTDMIMSVNTFFFLALVNNVTIVNDPKHLIDIMTKSMGKNPPSDMLSMLQSMESPKENPKP